MIPFRFRSATICTLAVYAVGLSAADQPMAVPKLKLQQFQRGDDITLDIESSSKPVAEPWIELAQGERSFRLAAAYTPPGAGSGSKTGTLAATIDKDSPLGTYSATLSWEHVKWPLGRITIQPPGNPGVHLKDLAPPYTYDAETAYIPDPSDRSAEKITVSDYAVPIASTQLSALTVKWRDSVFPIILNGCAYTPHHGSENNPVSAPFRFFARETTSGTIEVCGVPTDAKIELSNGATDSGAKQTGNASDMWLSKPKKSIPQRVVSVVLHGSGFQVGRPGDNSIWIDGVRQYGIVWDTCSNKAALGASNAPIPLTIHGEVISPEEIRLCSVPVPETGQVRLATGYGDVQSEVVGMRVFGMGRAGVALWALAISLVLALLPLALLSTVQRAYRIGNADYKWRMLFLDPETNTYSLSKLQFYMWTVAALFTYAYLFISRVRVQFGPWPDIPSTLPGIIAVAGGTAVTSQIVTSAKGSKGSGEERPSFADFITSGGVVAADRLQMFLWTLFGVGAFLYAVWQLEPGTISDLPAVPERLLVLMGISSAGYLGGKMARKAGPVINEISIDPPEPDATILQEAMTGAVIPDLVQATIAAQSRLAELNAVPTANANARAAIAALSQALNDSGAAHTMTEFNQLVSDLAGKRAAAETAATNAAADFVNGKSTQGEAEAAQSAAAALQDFTADIVQAISMSSAAPMDSEISPPSIARTIQIRGSNLSPEAMFQIDYSELPFRMLFDTEGRNMPAMVVREDATPTFARVLKLTLDPARLGTADRLQFTKWFATGGHHTLSITNPDGQKAERGYDMPPGVAQKAGS